MTQSGWRRPGALTSCASSSASNHLTSPTPLSYIHKPSPTLNNLVNTANALQGPRRDEEANGWALRAQRRCDREHDQTGDEHASPPVSVTQRRPGENGGSEGERVCIDRPAQPLD